MISRGSRCGGDESLWIQQKISDLQHYVVEGTYGSFEATCPPFLFLCRILPLPLLFFFSFLFTTLIFAGPKPVKAKTIKFVVFHKKGEGHGEALLSFFAGAKPAKADFYVHSTIVFCWHKGRQQADTYQYHKLVHSKHSHSQVSQPVFCQVWPLTRSPEAQAPDLKTHQPHAPEAQAPDLKNLRHGLPPMLTPWMYLQQARIHAWKASAYLNPPRQQGRNEHLVIDYPFIGEVPMSTPSIGTLHLFGHSTQLVRSPHIFTHLVLLFTWSP
eukprot:232983-Pelagomonas_calceolata.AAC.3